MVKGKRKRVLDGFENYQINENGDIYLLNYYYPDYDCYGVLSKRVDRAGYYTVRLYQDKKSYTKFLHRLLAEAFIPNPENKQYINHKDSNKLNCSLDNLEWTTHSENIAHAYSLCLIERKNKPVIDTQSGYIYNSVKEAALSSGLSYSTLKNYLNGNRPNPTYLKYQDNTCFNPSVL